MYIRNFYGNLYFLSLKYHHIFSLALISSLYIHRKSHGRLALHLILTGIGQAQVPIPGATC